MILAGQIMESRDEEILRAEQIKAVSKAWILHKLDCIRPICGHLGTADSVFDDFNWMT